MDTRINKGKPPPGLTTPECHCPVFHRYLLPCRHIFQEHIFGNNRLLTEGISVEAGYEIYEHRELVELAELLQTAATRDAKRTDGARARYALEA
jgi:hypothetical protein